MADTELITRILNGEKALFEWVIRRYNQRLFRVGMSVLRNDMEAEDAMQVTYIKAYEHLASFENRSSLGTWLTRIMLNECLTVKKQKKRFTMEKEPSPDHAASEATPSSILMNKELSSVLENAVAQLPEKYRTVFVLREIEKMSVKQTGEVLELEDSNIKVRLNRAKTMLREHLGQYMKEQVYAFHLTRCDRMVQNVLGRLNIL